MTFEQWWEKNLTNDAYLRKHENMYMKDAFQRIWDDRGKEDERRIRESCSQCNGTGIIECEPDCHYVTHEMALDAGDPTLEGTVHIEDVNIQCEYCGRPIDALKN